MYLGLSVTLHPSMILSHLQLCDPGAVPVGLPRQLDKELPLSSAFHGWWRGGVRRGIRSRGNRDGRRRFTPSPVEDLLHASFDWRTLEEGKRQSILDSVSWYCVYSPTAEWECLGAHRASGTQPLSIGDLRQRRVETVDVVGGGAGVTAQQLAAVFTHPTELHVVVILLLRPGGDHHPDPDLWDHSVLAVLLKVLKVLVLCFPLYSLFFLKTGKYVIDWHLNWVSRWVQARVIVSY